MIVCSWILSQDVQVQVVFNSSHVPVLLRVTVVSVLIKPWLASVAAKCSCRYWCVSSSLRNSFTCFGKQQRQVQTYTVISANFCRTRTFSLAIFLIERVSNYIELIELMISLWVRVGSIYFGAKRSSSTTNKKVRVWHQFAFVQFQKNIFSEIINSTRVYTFLSSTVAQVRQEVHFNSELLKREVILQAQ
jgi:hypothetical protein